MPKFRKKPVVIEAIQWFRNGDHPEDGVAAARGQLRPAEGRLIRYFRHPDIPSAQICSECGIRFHDHGWIDTLEGGHRVCPGDWIITGIKGERYPCKDKIFRATYDPVD